MRISDEIVQEAVGAYYPVFTPNGEALEDMRRALSAVLPKLMVKVQQLEWEKTITCSYKSGEYFIYPNNLDQFVLMFRDDITEIYESLPVAKAAAQADYERRMLQGLEIVKDGTLINDGTKTVDVGELSGNSRQLKYFDLTAVREALDGISVYGHDTLSGKIQGTADAEWYRVAVRIMAERADATIRALSAEPAQGEHWHSDMDEAPKDTLLLLACTDWPLMIKGREVPIKIGGYWNDQWNIFGASWAPTHWMPLPAAPTMKGQQHDK